MGNEGPAGERVDKTQQIQRQRHHPKERRGGDVRRDVGGNAEQQRGGHRAVSQPGRPPPPGGLFTVRGLERTRSRSRVEFASHCRAGRAASRRLGASGFFQGVSGWAIASPRRRKADAPVSCPARDDAERKHRKAERPGDGLGTCRQQRFQHEWKRQQHRHAARIAGRVQEVRVVSVGMAAKRKPALQEWRRCREGKEGRADRYEQQRHQPRGGWRAGIGPPVRADADGQGQGRRTEHDGVNDELAARPEPPAQPVRIGVPGEQHALKEDHGGVPHQGRAAEQRQRHLGEQRLNPEQQNRTGKDRTREQGRIGGWQGHRQRLASGIAVVRFRPRRFGA